jgi:hypothetical protein
MKWMRNYAAFTMVTMIKAKRRCQIQGRFGKHAWQDWRDIREYCNIWNLINQESTWEIWRQKRDCSAIPNCIHQGRLSLLGQKHNKEFFDDMFSSILGSRGSCFRLKEVLPSVAHCFLGCCHSGINSEAFCLEFTLIFFTYSPWIRTIFMTLVNNKVGTWENK